MAKRPAPPASSSALPSGTAFRKSASKRRKGEDGLAKVDALKVKSDAAKAPLHGASHKGKGKEKQSEATPKPTVSAMKSKKVEPTQAGSRRKQAAQPKAATNGKQKESARFKDAASGEVEAPTAKLRAAGQDMAMLQPNKKNLGPPNSFRVVVGSYERLLYGFHVSFQGSGADRTASFETMFSFAAHTSCITAIAAAGADSKWLATGAGDETVRVWDLKKKKEVGGLIGHTGTIHSLSFPARTYLLSADSSGLINLYRTRDWSLLKTLRGHTGQINACVAHPSGKLALSVGKDGMLRMWDLMRGKGAGAVRLNLGQEEGGKVLFKEEPLDVKWNKSGTRFAVMGRTEVVVYKTDMNRIAGLLVRRDDPKRRFGCVEWQGDDVLLTGNEMGVVEVYKITDSSVEGPVGKLLGHTNRVRSVRTIELQLEDQTGVIIATTASSDGKVRIYDISALARDTDGAKNDAAVEIQPMATHDTGGARLTCLDVVGGSAGSAASSTTDLQEDEEDEDAEEEELNQAELEELYDLLDLVEEAKRQGVDVEGLSEFESGQDDDDDEEGSDDDDVYGDSELEGLEEDEEEEVESEGEDEMEQESD